MLQQANLHTADELYQYSCDHHLGTGLGRNWGITNFRLVEKNMDRSEGAFLAFVGLHQFRSMSCHQRNFAYAVTQRRILMGQVRTFGRIRFQSVPLNEILGISFDTENSVGVMKILLNNDAIIIGLSQESATALSRELTELLPHLQELAHEMSAQAEA